jgi:hypothetical protein
MILRYLQKNKFHQKISQKSAEIKGYFEKTAVAGAGFRENPREWILTFRHGKAA